MLAQKEPSTGKEVTPTARIGAPGAPRMHSTEHPPRRSPAAHTDGRGSTKIPSASPHRTRTRRNLSPELTLGKSLWRKIEKHFQTLLKAQQTLKRRTNFSSVYYGQQFTGDGPKEHLENPHLGFRPQHNDRR